MAKKNEQKDERVDVFKLYVDGLKGVTEAPAQFHHFALACALGAMIGRRMYIPVGGKPLYPNLYIVLVGESGLTRKSTAMWYVRHYFRKAFFDPDTEKVDYGFRWLSGLNSLEGLLVYMKEHDMSNVLLRLEELALLLKIAARKGTNNIISGITQLYDMPDEFQLVVKHKAASIEVLNPTLSILAASTQGWLKDNLHETDIYGGFANRFVYVLGESTEPIAFPRQPDPAWEWQLIRRLREIRSFIEDISNQGEIMLLEPAKNIFTFFYHKHRLNLKDLENEIQIEALKRLPDHVLKLALIYAVSNCQRWVGEEDMARAVRAGERIFEWVLQIFDDYSKTLYTRVEERILELLAERPHTKRELQRSIWYKGVTPQLFNNVINELISDGKIKLKKVGRKKILELTE